jgi:membrane fusion protein, multidrug efflux system
VTVENSDGARLATGKLTVSDNQVDVATATIRLKAEFENTDNTLWPGLAVTTELTLGVDKNVLLVPEDAVQHGENGLFVYVADAQNRAEVRPVKVARQNVTTAVVSEGLEEGERVVTAGQLLLQPGVQVAIDAGRGS